MPDPEIPPTTAASDRVEVGYVSKAHGVKGEIVAITHDPASVCLGDVPAIWLGGREYEVVRSRPVPGAFLILLAGITDRDVAGTLRGQKIEVSRDDLDLDDDEVLLADLVGCQTQLPDGTPWGEIVGIELGPQDRLVIHHDGKEKLLPVVDAFLGEVDLERRIVMVTPPEGIPEDPIAPARRR